MKKIILFFVFLFLGSYSTFAQQIIGSVKNSENHSPIVGVTFRIGTNEVTSTNAEGNFKINLSSYSDNDSIFVHHLGYKQRSFAVKDFKKKLQPIYLLPKINELEEVFAQDSKQKMKTYGYKFSSFVSITLAPSPSVIKTIPDIDTLGTEQVVLMSIDKHILLQKLVLSVHLYKNKYSKLVYKIHFYNIEKGLPHKEIFDTPVYYTVQNAEIGLNKFFELDLRPYQLEVKGFKKIAVGFELISKEINEDRKDSLKQSFFVNYTFNPSKHSFIRASKVGKWYKQPKISLIVSLKAQVLKKDENIEPEESYDLKSLEVFSKPLLNLLGIKDLNHYLGLQKQFEEASQSPFGKNKGFFIPVSKGKIYYETYGEGEPLVLLHGNSGSISHFYKQIPEFLKHYKVIAIDTRGQGNSIDESDQDFTYEQFSEDLKTVLDSLKLTKVHILGWSDGGNTALIMAYRYPEYVKSIITSGAVLSPNGVHNHILHHLKQKYEESNQKEASSISRRLQKILLTEPYILVSDLKQISCPSLIVAGEDDVVKYQHTKRITQNIFGSQLLIIKGATHYPAWEQSKIFNQEVLNFLDNIK